MMAMPVAHRAVSEAALRLIQHNYADYRATRGLRGSHGRILANASALGSWDVTATRRQSYYLRLISVVEAYADLLYRDLFNADLLLADPTVQLLIDELDHRSRGWGDRGANFKLFHQIPLSDCPAWKSYEAGTHVRNTIAHGLGRLTFRQMRNVDLPAKLNSIDVQIRDGRIILTERSVSTAAKFCKDLISQLDSASSS